MRSERTEMDRAHKSWQDQITIREQDGDLQRTGKTGRLPPLRSRQMPDASGEADSTRSQAKTEAQTLKFTLPHMPASRFTSPKHSSRQNY
jgi:hypothetical protein